MNTKRLTLYVPDIKMHILITDLHTFLMKLVRRICLNIKTSYLSDHFLYSGHLKFHFRQGLGLKGLRSCLNLMLRSRVRRSYDKETPTKAKTELWFKIKRNLRISFRFGRVTVIFRSRFRRFRVETEGRTRFERSSFSANSELG